jgi:hypothetical protein
MMNLLKKLRRFFQRLCKSKAKQQRHAFQEWQRTRPPSLPDVPTIDLAKQRIETKPAIPYRVGNVLAQDRAKHGLKTIRLEPFPWLEDDSWLNSGLLPIPPVSPVYEPPEVETEHMPAFVKALHERKRNDEN